MYEEIRLLEQKFGRGTTFKMKNCTVQIYTACREIDS